MNDQSTPDQRPVGTDPVKQSPANAKHRIAVVVAIMAIAACMLILTRYESASAAQERVTLKAEDLQGVFAKPKIQQVVDRLRKEVTFLFRQGDYVTGETQCRALLELLPEDPTSLYNLGCALARQNKPDDAITQLTAAVEHGFRSPDHLAKDPDLDSLKQREDWKRLLEAAAEPFTPRQQKVTIHPAPIHNGVAIVQESNSVWVPAQRLIHSFFRDEQDKDNNKPIATGFDDASERLKQWYEEGSAAGHAGVLYDNHDADHSNLDWKRYPQLARIEYSDAAKRHSLHNGVQTLLHFNGIVIGNSSTAIVGSPFWRSQARLAYTDGRSPTILAAQYFTNHLYFYPEHRDYDPGTNGKGGYGDVFPANTPYVIVSQGSSYSDREFMDAIAATLAAFRPETRKLLAEKAALMPTVQMIFRSSNSQVREKQDYLTGLAHPVVFQGYQIDKLKMVELAHEMQPDSVPPIAVMEVVNEDKFEVNQDYFDIGPREELFTTPAAIARVCQSLNETRKMTVSVEKSQELNGKELSFHWSVLQGDPERITIKPTDDGRQATITVKHQQRRLIREGSSIESSRVDIGVFADNGTYYSAPGIISFYWPENETRTYHADGRIQAVEYKTQDKGGLYADPVIITPRNWRDEFEYDHQKQLIGWTRIRGKMRERFTADGRLVTETDSSGRILKAVDVIYSAEKNAQGTPILKQTAATTVAE